MFIFGNRQMVQSPVRDQSFVWVAEYVDGTHLAEFDFMDGKANSFYNIDRTKILRFGLLGENSQVYFDVGNGVFTLNKHRLTVSYVANGVEYPLTGRTLVYNDLITYKDAVSDAAPLLKGKGAFTNTIMQFNVGYKKRMELEDVNISFQAVLGIPLNSSAVLSLKITSDTDLDGELIIRRNGMVVENINAPLKAGHAGQIDWTIK
jgi:hypothetical protein